MQLFIYIDVSIQSSKLSTERQVDVGAHWVGRTQHRVMDLVQQFGLGLRPQYLRGTKVMQVDRDFVSLM